MTTLRYDFSQVATLSHHMTGSGDFTGTDEIGRASATLGTSNAATRVAAGHLGDDANGFSFRLRGGGPSISREGRSIDVAMAAGASAADAAAWINHSSFDPRLVTGRMAPDAITSQLRNLRPMPTGEAYFALGADTAGGTGASGFTSGVAPFAGGLAPSRSAPNFYEYDATDHGGLFVFDHHEPLVLVQFVALFSGSVSWGLTLRRLTAARADAGDAITIATATASSALVLNTPVIILPGWGIGVSASAQGRAMVSVKKA